MRTPTVCREYLDHVLQYLYSNGVTVSALKTLLRVDPEDHVSERGRVPLRLFELTLEAGGQLLGDNFVGAHAGARPSQTAWGLVNYLGMSAPDTRTAIASVVKFAPLLIDHGELAFTQSDGDMARLTWTIPEKQLPSRQVVEFFFANWYRVNKPALDRWCSRREIRFSHACPGNHAELERIIEAPVHFGSVVNCVEFDGHFLDRPVRFPHPVIFESLLQTASGKLAELTAEDRVIRDVIDCVREQLSIGVPKLELVAATLNLTPRTLQRRLSDANTTFKALLDQARQELSLSLMADNKLGLIDVAETLGFSDQSAFQKAFKRWFGQAPGQYRAVQQATR